MRFCARCDNSRWVCEAHPDRPWLGGRACDCGAPGDPCPICNHADADNPPAMPDGFVADMPPEEGNLTDSRSATAADAVSIPCQYHEFPPFVVFISARNDG
jgi:hypothetical protein